MKINNCLALIASALLFTLTACSSSQQQSSTTDGEMVDQSIYGDQAALGDIYVGDDLGYGGLAGDAMTSIDQNGTLVIGDPNADPNAPYDPTFAGPQALRDNNVIYFRYD